MSLSVQFEDLYRCYQALILPKNGQAFFLATSQIFPLGSTTELQVNILSPAIDFSVDVSVISRRAAISSSLPAGLSIELTKSGKETVEKIINLAMDKIYNSPKRQFYRYKLSLPVSLLEPFMPQKIHTLDFSRGGLRLVLPPRISPKTKPVIEVDLNGYQIERRTEIVWSEVVNGVIHGGLKFSMPIDLSDDALQEKLGSMIQAPTLFEDKNIVIAVSDMNTQQQMENFYNKRKINTHTAKSAEEIISKSWQVKPTIIFIDVLQQNSNAFELCSFLHEDAHLARVPIIILNNQDDATIRENAIQAGAFAFYPLPLSEQTLEQITSNAINFGRG